MAHSLSSKSLSVSSIPTADVDVARLPPPAPVDGQVMRFAVGVGGSRIRCRRSLVVVSGGGIENIAVGVSVCCVVLFPSQGR